MLAIEYSYIGYRKQLRPGAYSDARLGDRDKRTCGGESERDRNAVPYTSPIVCGPTYAPQHQRASLPTVGSPDQAGERIDLTTLGLDLRCAADSDVF
jgi:hypothetical protein